MQLLRLATDSADGLFDNMVQEDVEIKANATVALQSLSCVPLRDSLDVTGQNDSITFEMTVSGGQRVANLDVNTYNSGSAAGLLTNIQDRLNGAFDTAVGADIGQQFQITSQNTRRHTVFGRRQAKLIDYSIDTTSTAVRNAVVGTSNAREWARSGGTVGNLDSFVGSGNLWNSGGAVFRGRIGKMGGAAAAGDVIIGVGTKDPLVVVLGDYALADIILGIRYTVDDAANPYGVIVNGVESASVTPPVYIAPNSTQNPVLQIARAGFGVLSATVSQGGADAVLGTVGAVPPGTKLYPIVLLVGDDTSTVTLLRSTADPWTTKAASDAPLPEDHHPSLGIAVQFSQPTINNTLVFESSTLAEWLGFRNVSYGPIVSAADGSVNFESEHMPLSSSLIDSVIVESLTLDIKSYTASWDPTRQSGRASILAVLTPDVPSAASGAPLVFTAPYPTFMSLRNARPQTHRRFRFRLLRSDLTPLRLQGEAVLTILISD
jgi:hypothetical protein